MWYGEIQYRVRISIHATTAVQLLKSVRSALKSYFVTFSCQTLMQGFVTFTILIEHNCLRPMMVKTGVSSQNICVS